jgi:CHAD domain-containing protein
VLTSRSELLRKRLERFTRVLQGLEDGNVRALHGARVASRRLRELLPVLQLDRDDTRKLSRRLRKITTRLGIVRELDVLLLLIDELHVSRRELNQALSRVAVAVAKDRDDARDALAKKLPVSELRRAARKLTHVADALADADAAARSVASRSWQWTIDARVAARAARLVTAIHDAGAVYLPERLHAVRITVKKLRYAVELRADVRAEKSATDLRLLRHAQDSLGRMHDIQVLIDRVRRVQASLTPPSVTVWRALDDLTIALDADCRALHARYMRRRSELLAVAERLSVRAQPGRKRTMMREATG